MIYIVSIILIILSFYAGSLYGVADCKKRFEIPKGVSNMDEWAKYALAEDEVNEVDNG